MDCAAVGVGTAQFFRRQGKRNKLPRVADDFIDAGYAPAAVTTPVNGDAATNTRPGTMPNHLAQPAQPLFSREE
ncbi:hypothetical protein CNE_BB2p02060 (plasmid) [Cupriavidus necator N-1]|uniref:Uncharacterized protein n=1 Tax=Cupriavidus necator (strain ATCC 43291 / DSM 13513 / CCUG 52238 / LMG 8453 / N-1) TaxID=1042878 RepID=F8GYS6_CUPNN|nr:hypothetical protein CNE_BB2p02060 [Cupriavidus necator N-1]